MTDRPDVDTLVDQIAKELPNPSWAHAALSDLAARARRGDDESDLEHQYQRRAYWRERAEAAEADRVRLARRVTELEAALERIGKGYHLEDHDYTGACNGRCAQKIARAALAGDGGGADG